MIFCHFCTKYELICSFNTFCTCIHLYYVQKTYKTTYEFHFQLVFSRRVQAVTSHGEHSLYLSAVLRVGVPDLYIFHCLFPTEYELICSFNTFCTCICPHYVQKTYKTTYEFHFQLAFSRRVRSVICSRRVRSVTSHGVSPHLAGRGTDHYIFRAFSVAETPFGTFSLSFLY